MAGLAAHLVWLWQWSRKVDRKGSRAWWSRLRLMREGLRHQGALRPFQHAPADGALGRAVRCRPQMLEAVIRPYQTVAWDADTRLDMLRRHYEQMIRLDWPQLSDPEAVVEIMPLDAVKADLRLVLDQPAWFAAEGPLVLNLFLGETRIYSLAFGLREDGGQLTASVGAIQGRALPDILDVYRDLTRAGHGLRPRDLLIEMFRMLCQAIGVGRILLVSDSHRQHRHSYFGAAAEAVVVNYDAIWMDRGACRVDEASFELPLVATRRGMADVPARKRSLYRRRYALLDGLAEEGRRRIALCRTGAPRDLPAKETSCAL